MGLKTFRTYTVAGVIICTSLMVACGGSSSSSAPSPKSAPSDDSEPPHSSSIVINNDAFSTSSTSATLSLSAQDNGLITEYFLSESPSDSLSDTNAWVTLNAPSSEYSDNIPYSFSEAEGVKTIYVWFKDASGNISSIVSDEIVLTPASPTVELGRNWIFLGDSETAGRANEVVTKSQVDAFKSIGDKTFSTPPTVYVNGISGRKLQATFDHYLSIAYRGNATLVHFQESGSQDSTQDTPEKFVAVFEQMVRSIVADSPFAVISVETAYSFEVEPTTNRYWLHHNVLMRKKVAELKAEGITVHIAEVDRNIQELIDQKQIELGSDAGQQAVWGDTDNSIGRHYTGLGNLMVALSIYDALGYDVNQLDLTGIPSSEISASDKQLCMSIINSN